MAALVALEVQDSNLGGEVIAGMADLFAGETIRLPGLVILHKDMLGRVVVKELRELPPADPRLLEPLRAEISGMVTIEDLKTACKKPAKISAAVIMLIENHCTQPES